MQEIDIKKPSKLDFQAKEAYKSLRTNIQFCGDEIKVITITSCVPGEGKSTVSMNLASSLVETGKKVLFIDADMRASILVGRYKMTNAVVGLSHYLSGRVELEIALGKTNISGLDIIIAGPVPPNPSELLGGKYFERLIEYGRDKYDYIIIDTPPLGSVIDSAIVSKLSDGVVIVISSDNVSFKLAQKVKKQLEAANCKILGAILNKVDLNNSYYGSYYGKYYGKYYGNNNGKNKRNTLKRI